MSARVGSIVKNTMFLYIRMFLLMAIGIYTSRVLLAVLGVNDLGIYNVVGSVILMLAFISSSLTNSSQRYLSIGLGNNDIDLTKRYFAQSLGLHFLLSIFIILLLETVGLWVVVNKLNIPADRKAAAMWVYQFSVLVAFIDINLVCYRSVLVARENMSMYAYLSIFEGAGNLAIIYMIKGSHFDRLAYYGFLSMAIQAVVLLVHVFYCYIKYPESHYKYYWDKNLYKEMFSFVSINVFGSLSWAMGIQGINIVLNIFFGPVVNAARGLAGTAGRFINQFVNNIYLAVKPQLIKSFAAGQYEEMLSLAEKSTTYIFYLVLIVSLPILFETNLILKIWLKNVPEYTMVFTQLVLVQSFFWMLPIPYSQIAAATGEIKNIQLYGRIITLAALPISYVVLLLIKTPYLPAFVLILSDCLFWLYTIHDVNKQLEIKFKRYFHNVIKPILYVTICTSLSVGLVHYILPLSSLLLLFAEAFFSLVFGVLFVWLLGMSKTDVKYFGDFIRKKLSGDKI